MKFREASSWSTTKFQSKAEYFEHRVYQNVVGCDGELETLRARVTYLEEVICRIIQHLPLDLEQLSEIVNGYDSQLEEIEE